MGGFYGEKGRSRIKKVCLRDWNDYPAVFRKCKLTLR